MPCSAPPPTPSPPSATATSRRSPGKDEWPGSATATIIKEPVSRASSRAGSRSSGTGCASTATGPGPPPSPPRPSTECSTLDARTPSAPHDQQRGMGAPLPLPPPCNTLAAVVVPPRATAVLSASAETDPTQRDRHIQAIAEQGRMGWQKTSGYNARAGVEGTMSRYKRIIGDTLRSHTRPAQETRIAVTVLNRMLDLGRPQSVRAA